jgi:hypothetical protein
VNPSELVNSWMAYCAKQFTPWDKCEAGIRAIEADPEYNWNWNTLRESLEPKPEPTYACGHTTRCECFRRF